MAVLLVDCSGRRNVPRPFFRVSEIESGVNCRVRLNNCDGTFAEEVVVPATSECLSELRLGDRVCVHYWDGKPVGIELVRRAT